MLATLVQSLSFQPVPLAAPAVPSGRAVARTAVHMQMDFLQKGLGGLKMPGMGDDDSGLSKEEAEAMEARMKSGGMDFDDFLKQVQVMQKAGEPRCSDDLWSHMARRPSVVRGRTTQGACAP